MISQIKERANNINILNLILVIAVFHTLPSLGSVENKMLPDSSSTANTDVPKNWFHLDFETDSYPGLSTERAYNELLKGKESKKVIVAVLDSGVDFMHEDLKTKIWTNKGEINDNGIDDDNNSYVDDIRGWNFIGSENGIPVLYDTYEVTRLLAIYKPKYENVDITKLSGETKKEYEFYKKLKSNYDDLNRRYSSMLKSMIYIKERYDKAEKTILEYLNADSVTIDQALEIETEIDSVNSAIEIFSYINQENVGLKWIEKGIEKASNVINYNLNLNFDPRYIVGDIYENTDEYSYGNPYVDGPEPSHGTHVSGIIAADRNNEIGIKGIADNAEIMILRVVPDGDERDKDIANAVYYAVDNGARIINMSFGKGYSPYKEYVDKAFRYASENGVLMVHAAGNDSENTDKTPNFPSRYYADGKECKTWIEVGAINWKNGKDRVSGFSNYGKKNVDIFAPGEGIYSTMPGDKYRNANGTSMAAPMVSGVAALVWSYYPDLTAKQLKNIILKSAVNCKREKVALPGSPHKIVKFKKLSGTGGIVNAYRALEMAKRIDRKH